MGSDAAGSLAASKVQELIQAPCTSVLASNRPFLTCPHAHYTHTAMCARYHETRPKVKMSKRRELRRGPRRDSASRSGASSGGGYRGGDSGDKQAKRPKPAHWHDKSQKRNEQKSEDKLASAVMVMVRSNSSVTCGTRASYTTAITNIERGREIECF